MLNRKIFAAVVVISLMFLSIMPTLISRIVYEQKTRNAFLSANYDNLLVNQLDVDAAIYEYHTLGVNFVTIKPETLKSMSKEGLIDIITYSSLTINNDSISEMIKAKLTNKQIHDNSSVIIAKSKNMADYLNSEFKVRYTGYIYEQIDENISVFCFNTNSDLIVGYDKELIHWLNELGMEAALEYPSYSFQNDSYADYFTDFLKQTNVEFLILKENEYDNRELLSGDFLYQLSKMNVKLVVFENKNQISNEKPSIYDELSKNLSATLIRGYNATETIKHDKSLFNYRYYQWYNSIIERNTKFINIELLKNEDLTNQENFELTKKAVDKLVNQLVGRKYTLDNFYRPIYYANMSQIAVIAGFIMILAMLYIYLLLAFSAKHIDILFIFTAFISILFNYAYYNSLANIYISILMIVSVALITLITFKLAKSSLKNRLFRIIQICVAILFCTSATISAMTANIDYHIGSRHFVDISFGITIPILITLYNYCLVFSGNIKAVLKAAFNPKRNEDSERASWVHAIFENKKQLILCVVILSSVIAYYILRNSKSNLILPFEYNLRTYLTDIFYIKPRFKEFLLGYEAFTFFLYFSIYKKFEKKNLLVFAVLSTVLFTSILNTFCHAATPYFTNVQRVFNGFLCYLIFLGIMLITIKIKSILHKEKKEKDKEKINYFIKKY